MTSWLGTRFQRYLVLLLATMALLVANGRWHLPLAAWLAPILVVIFLDTQPPWRGLALLFPVQILAFFVNWWGMIPVPGLWYFLVAGIYGTVYYLPFICHRIAIPRLSGFKATLVLPASGVAVEWLFQQLITPYGSWAAVAYTQVDHLALMQLVAVTGMAGIYFLILWCASVVGYCWRHGRSSGAVLLGAVLLSVLLAGELSLAYPADQDNTVRITGITPSAKLSRELDREVLPMLGASPSEAAMAGVLEIVEQLNGDLLRRSETAARANADVVVWSEHAGRVTSESEGFWIAQAQELARRFDTIFLLSLGVWNPRSKLPFENKVVAIDGRGEVAWEYHKARPIVGAESARVAGASVQLATLDTAAARLGLGICHDLDFPDFIRQAGWSQVDILLAPSSDWPAITPFHARMAQVRAIENGLTLFRPCAQGRSVAVDSRGRTLAAQDDLGDQGNEWTVQIPTSRRNTLFPMLGDGFAYLNLLVWFGLMVLAVRGRK